MAELRRVGVIGDVHAEDRALETTLRFLKGEALDAILCVGDVADGRGDVDACCRLLVEARVECVRGNHDRWLLRNELRDLEDATRVELLSRETLAYIKGLPTTRRFETPAGRLLVCHGLGETDMASVGPDDVGYALEANDVLQNILGTRDVAIVVNGHTHKRMVRRIDHLTIINAGTLFSDHEPGFLIVDFAANVVRLYDLQGDRVVAGASMRLPTSTSQAG
jgi:putative phosphoesterase